MQSDALGGWVYLSAAVCDPSQGVSPVKKFSVLNLYLLFTLMLNQMMDNFDTLGPSAEPLCSANSMV